MSLAEPRIQQLLGTRDVVLLATVQPDGAPLAMPMWFLHDPATLTMISVAGTQKVKNLRRDPRVCVVAEGGSSVGDVRGVAVHGRAEFLVDGPESGFSRSTIPT
jgi:general stress protein 26